MFMLELKLADVMSIRSIASGTQRIVFLGYCVSFVKRATLSRKLKFLIGDIIKRRKVRSGSSNDP